MSTIKSQLGTLKTTLSKLANNFSTTLLVSGADISEDLLAKNTPAGGERIEPEMTEEINDLVQDSLNLVILLERAFIEFQKQCLVSNNRMGLQLCSNVLLELEDIEMELSNSDLLKFYLNLEIGGLDMIDQNASMIKSVLDMTMDAGVPAPEFNKLDVRVYKWINELIANGDKIHDLSTAQSSYMEENIADRPVRMIEQDVRVPDEISEEELHPDFEMHPFEPELNNLNRIAHKFAAMEAVIDEEPVPDTMRVPNDEPYQAGLSQGKLDLLLGTYSKPFIAWKTMVEEAARSNIFQDWMDDFHRFAAGYKDAKRNK